MTKNLTAPVIEMNFSLLNILHHLMSKEAYSTRNNGLFTIFFYFKSFQVFRTPYEQAYFSTKSLPSVMPTHTNLFGNWSRTHDLYNKWFIFIKKVDQCLFYFSSKLEFFWKTGSLTFLKDTFSFNFVCVAFIFNNISNSYLFVFFFIHSHRKS